MVSSTPWSVDSGSALSFDLFQILTFMFILCIPGAVQVVSDMIMMMATLLMLTLLFQQTFTEYFLWSGTVAEPCMHISNSFTY